MRLVVYRCYDNFEEESCFLVNNDSEAKDFLDKNPKPPEGYEHRSGYYFFEVYDFSQDYSYKSMTHRS